MTPKEAWVAWWGGVDAGPEINEWLIERFHAIFYPDMDFEELRRDILNGDGR